jgi:hypothetical protein
LASVPTATGAADPENTRHHADAGAEAEQHEDIYRNLGNGQIDMHRWQQYPLVFLSGVAKTSSAADAALRHRQRFPVFATPIIWREVMILFAS